MPGFVCGGNVRYCVSFVCSVMWRLIIFAVLLIASPLYANEKPLVIASIRPLALIAEDLAGDLIDTQVLLEAPASPHDFSLTISQAILLTDASMLLWVGPDFERFLAGGVRTKINISMQDVTDHSTDRHTDFHLWLDSQQVADFANDLSHQLVKLLPESKVDIIARHLAFVDTLAARVAKTEALLAPLTSTPFAVHHEAYSYFVRQFRLTQIGSLTMVPHQRISAKRLAEVGRAISSASCLLVESTEVSEASRYARLFDKQLVKVELLANDDRVKTFDSYMANVANAFFECLA